MPQPDSLREAFMVTVESFLNVPYRWGGDDPLEGVDCSGLVLEGLKATGMVPRDADYNADALLNTVFAANPRVVQPQALQRGMLVFWSQPGKPIHHVEIVWARYLHAGGVRVLTIGASGGGSATVDRAAAVRQNAYVKLRRATTGWIAAVDPWS